MSPTGFGCQPAYPKTLSTAARIWASGHGPKLGVRTVDSLHVATALELKAERFWTFDDRQQKLAKIVGLRIL